jgi:GNAT superfamily N-acetyltransferase
LQILDATPGDCAAVSALAFASKAYWGYDDAFMEACRAELTVMPADLERGRVRVACEGEVIGFHGVIDSELEWLFVAPQAIGRRVGAALFTDALEIARAGGLEVLRIAADPNAAGFYERMGARLVGETPSASIPGRMMPVYAIGLSSTA